MSTSNNAVCARPSRHPVHSRHVWKVRTSGMAGTTVAPRPLRTLGFLSGVVFSPPPFACRNSSVFSYPHNEIYFRSADEPHKAKNGPSTQASMIIPTTPRTQERSTIVPLLGIIASRLHTLSHSSISVLTYPFLPTFYSSCPRSHACVVLLLKGCRGASRAYTEEGHIASGARLSR